MLKMKYLKDGEGCAFTTFRDGLPVGRRAIMTDTCNIQLPLTGDTFLNVNNPQWFVSIDFKFGNLVKKDVSICYNFAKSAPLLKTNLTYQQQVSFHITKLT